jgi:hypothetical protein
MQKINKMRIFLILGFCTAMSLVAAASAMADTVTIGSSLDGLVHYDEEYCGKIGATLNGTTDQISGGMACVDISQNSQTGATITVSISTLQPSVMTNARFGSDAAGIFKYEEAAWLLGQMPSHADQVGEIQFAIWRIFEPDHVYSPSSDRTAATIAIEDSWMNLAAKINPQDYDFSSIRIYTPTNITEANALNQEFMSGAAEPAHAPIPASALLLASGLVGLGVLRFRKKEDPDKGRPQQ